MCSRNGSSCHYGCQTNIFIRIHLYYIVCYLRDDSKMRQE
jgi:hypothetical protein